MSEVRPTSLKSVAPQEQNLENLQICGIGSSRGPIRTGAGWFVGDACCKNCCGAGKGNATLCILSLEISMSLARSLSKFSRPRLSLMFGTSLSGVPIVCVLPKDAHGLFDFEVVMGGGLRSADVVFATDLLLSLVGVVDNNEVSVESEEGILSTSVKHAGGRETLCLLGVVGAPSKGFVGEEVGGSTDSVPLRYSCFISWVTSPLSSPYVLASLALGKGPQAPRPWNLPDESLSPLTVSSALLSYPLLSLLTSSSSYPCPPGLHLKLPTTTPPNSPRLHEYLLRHDDNPSPLPQSNEPLPTMKGNWFTQKEAKAPAALMSVFHILDLKKQRAQIEVDMLYDAIVRIAELDAMDDDGTSLGTAGILESHLPGDRFNDWFSTPSAPSDTSDIL
ncbi:uncharacterized protein F5147DRAFT_781264 [Suillus discolor]|uniref:Uncharacterized protein n=1 Tax=Suillus discolor TaxID=1912936 RepID=A0A9P7ES42_9AGAM|nr:uncharacterized protein F5147DRAFT_781264 [Suillus discolor]KAG2087620.1 hypothetical protein F5147DRAFT_781264 [Suillus discolor]